jgi:hypothetical protein
MVDPGLTWVAQWRPVSKEYGMRAPRWAYAGIGRKQSALS